MWSRLVAIVFALLIPTLALTQEPTEKPKSFVVEVVDGDGKPVEGAEVGIYGSVGEYEALRTLADKDGTQWYYNCHARTGANGTARMSDDDDLLQRLCLIARHEGRKISAVANVDPLKLMEPIKLTLVPECVITADVICSELAGKWRPIQNLEVRYAGKRMLSYVCMDVKIRLPLPPGNYEFEVYGSMTCNLKRPVQVVAAETQKLETFDLPASNLGLLQGRPAPEISDIVGWKNGPAPKLTELRGKCVILDFFGYWCGPCVEEMPELITLYEKYRDQGLVVIGVHTDLGDNEEEPVDTADRLDKRLAEVRANLWQGRDIPFPVALTKCARTKYREDLPGFNQTARSATGAKYGIVGYPTQVLIDRKGNVVGPLDLRGDGIKLLEKALLDK